MTIAALLDKKDNFEIVRDQIAQILADEVSSQVNIALGLKKNPNHYDARVFTERSNPWEQWLNSDETLCGEKPIINVWFDNATFDPNSSNISERQKTTGSFNIDCYGYGRSTDDPRGGHNAGDSSAAYEVQRALKLVRNILMAAEYTYLDLRGLVWQRWCSSITVFQPQLGERAIQNVVGARLVLNVQYNEFSPQVEPSMLCELGVEIKRAENGEVVAQVDYEYPLP